MEQLIFRPFRRSSRAIAGLLATFLAAVGNATAVPAADGTWNGSAGATWSTSAENWLNVSGTPWDATNGPTNTAFFSTANASATVSGTVWTNAISFSDTGTISGGTITLAGSSPAVTASANATIGSVLTGTMGLRKLGSGTLSISGANTYTGTTTISAGAFQLGVGGTTGSLSTSSAVVNNGTLLFNRSNTTTQGTDLGTVISGSGGIVLAGSGTVSLSNLNTYTGNIAVNAGTLLLASGAGNSFTTTGLGANTVGKTLTVASGASLVTTVTDAIDYGSTTANNIGVTISGTWNNNPANTAGTGFQRVDSLTLNGGVINDYGQHGSGFGGIFAANTITVLGTSTYNQLGGGSGLALGLPTTISIPSADGLFVIAGGMRNPASFITTSPASLVKTGSGTLRITGSSSYTGGTQINGGVLALGNAAAIGSAGTISFGGGTLQFSGSNTVDYSSRFSTAANQAYRLDTNSQNVTLASALTSSGGSLTKLGSGTLTLSATNTYTGTTTVSGGVLQAGIANAFGSSAPLAVNSGTVNLAGFNQTVGALSGSAGGWITTSSAAGTTTLTTSVAIGSATFAGTIADNGAGLVAFTKSGAGTQIFSTANAYSGTTTINAGVLQIGAGGTAGGLSASSAITGSAGATLAFSRTDDYGGVFANSIGGAVNVTLNSGTLTLSTANVYTGTTTVSGAVLQAGIANAFGSAAPLAVNSGTVNLAGFNQTVGALSGSAAGRITTSSAAGTATLTTSVASGTSAFAGVIADNGSGRVALTKSGAGALSLSGASTFSGDVLVNEGTLQLQTGGNPSGGGSSNVGANTAGRTLTVASGASLVTTVTDAIDYGSTTVNNIGVTISGTWNNNPANTAGTGFQRIDSLTLNGGVINDYGQHDGGFGGFGGIFAAGTVTVFGTSTYNQLGGGSGLGLGLPTTINVPAADGLFVVAGGMRNPSTFITGGAPSSLVKTGSGTLRITGSSSYTGGTQINGGVLALGNAAAIGSSGAISFGGGTLQFSSSNTTDYSSRFSGAANQAYRLDTNGQNVTLANGLTSSGGSLTKLGSGTLSLTGANTYTGTTTISAGAFQLGVGGTTGSLSTSSAVVNNGTLIFNRSNTTTQGTDLANVVSGSGGIVLAGSGTVSLSNQNTYTGNIAVNAGTLLLASAAGNSLTTTGLGANTVGKTLTVASGASLVTTVTDAIDYGSTTVNNIGVTISGTWNNNPANTAGTGFQRIDSLTLNGGVINDYGQHDGGFGGFGGIFAAGTVTVFGTSTYNQLGGGSGLGLGLPTTINVPAADGLFVVAGGMRNPSTFITGGAPSSLVKTGSGTLRITGSSSYTGGTQINGGVLSISTTSAVGGSSGVSIAGGAGLTYTGGAASFNKPITVTSGTGTVRNSGGGTLTLTGTLSKNGTVLRLAGGAFNVTGLITGANANSDLLVDAAAVTLSNTNTYNGPTFVINSGTLTLGINNAIPNNSIVTLGNASSAGTLDMNGYSDAIGGLAFGTVGGTLRVAATSTSAAPLTAATGTMSLTNGTLDLTGSGTSAGLYRVISAQSITGSFASVTGTTSAYRLLTTSTSVDYQQRAVIGAVAVTSPTVAIITGGSAAFTYSVANTALSGGASLSFTGTGLSSVAGSSAGSAVSAGTSGAVSGLVFTGTSVGLSQLGTFTVTDPNAFGSTTATGTVSVTVLDHATASLGASLLTGTTISLGTYNYMTNTWESGSSSAAFSIFNIASGFGNTLTADLSLVGVSGTGNGFSTNLNAYADIAGGSFGQYLVLVDPSGWGSSGLQTNTFILSTSDKTGMSGATASNTLYVTAQVVVVPEPGAVAIAGIGVSLAGWRMLRRRRGMP